MNVRPEKRTAYFSLVPRYPAKSTIVERSSIIDGLYRCRRKRKRNARVAYARAAHPHSMRAE